MSTGPCNALGMILTLVCEFLLLLESCKYPPPANQRLTALPPGMVSGDPPWVVLAAEQGKMLQNPVCGGFCLVGTHTAEWGGKCLISGNKDLTLHQLPPLILISTFSFMKCLIPLHRRLFSTLAIHFNTSFF